MAQMIIYIIIIVPTQKSDVNILWKQDCFALIYCRIEWNRLVTRGLFRKGRAELESITNYLLHYPEPWPTPTMDDRKINTDTDNEERHTGSSKQQGKAFV